MSGWGILLFAFCAALALGSAVGTVASRRPLRAAMSLLFHILSLAGLYLTLKAQFLAALQLLVYAGAVVVLFVFVIMLIGPDSEAHGTGRNVVVRIVSFAFGAVLTGAIAFTVVDHVRERPPVPVCAEDDAACSEFGGATAMGRVLFTDALVPFELVGVLLTVAIVGAMAVARGKSRAEEDDAKKKKAAADAGDAARAAAHGGP